MKKIGKGLFYIMLIILAIIFIAPLVYAIYNSLLPLDKVNKIVPVSVLSFDNYKDLFTNYDILSWYKNTLTMAIITLVGQLTTGLLAGYAIAKLNFKGKKFIFTIIVVTLMIPFQLLLVPLYIMVAGLGWHNSMLSLTIPFILNPLYVFMARQFFITIPNELIEASRIDGLSHANSFFRVILPISKPIVITITIFNFTQSWNAYLVPATFTSSDKMYTLVVGLNTLKDTYFNRINLTMAGVVMITIPVLIVFLVLQKYLIEGIATSGIKG